MKVLSVHFSRNGSGCAAPFITVFFEDKQQAKEMKGSGDMFIATWEDVATAKQEIVINEATIRVNNLKNFSSCWRGDWFARHLPEAIRKYCEKLKVIEISIAAACFPDQYQKETVPA